MDTLGLEEDCRVTNVAKHIPVPKAKNLGSDSVAAVQKKTV